MLEATIAIAALSLNDGNKISIVEHADFEVLRKNHVMNNTDLAVVST